MKTYRFSLIDRRKSIFTYKEYTPKSGLLYFHDQYNNELLYAQWTHNEQRIIEYKRISGTIWDVNKYRVIFDNPVYRILTYDDRDRGLCTDDMVDKVQRDENGELCPITEYEMYASSDKILEDRISKEFIETDSKILSQHL